MCYTHFMSHTIITYDIFQLAKDLKKSKIPDDAIDALIKFEKAKDEAMLDTLATKHDIELIQKDLKALESKLDSKIERQSYKTILALVVLIPTILKILEHFKI